MLLSWVLLAFLKLSFTGAYTHHLRVIRQTGLRTCRTPNNVAGYCVNLKNCPEILQQINNANKGNKAAAQFVRLSQCGFSGGISQTCCKAPENIVSGSSKIPVTATTNRAETTECGIPDAKETRIVGGKNATLGAWPWIAALGYQVGNSPTPSFRCGGSLISDRWVITAAHCLANLPSNMRLTTVRLGDLDLDPRIEDGATPIDVPVDEIIIHSGYTRSPVTNDIGLLRLRNPVQFSKYIRPICLMTGAAFKSDTYYDRKRPHIIGWGAVQWQGPSTTRLQHATISVVNTSECTRMYSQQRSPTIIDQRVLCAGKPGVDTCQGDSGGPLIFAPQEEDRFYLGGIVSFGYKCADPDFAGVYTRVAAFTEWISQNAKLS